MNNRCIIPTWKWIDKGTMIRNPTKIKKMLIFIVKTGTPKKKKNKKERCRTKRLLLSGFDYFYLEKVPNVESRNLRARLRER